MFSPCTFLGLKGRQNLGVFMEKCLFAVPRSLFTFVQPLPGMYKLMADVQKIYICQYPLASRLISVNGGGVDVFVKIYLTVMFLAISKQVCFE